MRFDSLPNELILKIATQSSRVWLKLALAVPFIGHWTIDDPDTLKRVQRLTKLPLIECWHPRRVSVYLKNAWICVCHSNPCVQVSKELAAFLCIDTRSELQKPDIEKAILVYARANGLLRCVKDSSNNTVYNYWEVIQLDAPLKRLFGTIREYNEYDAEGMFISSGVFRVTHMLKALKKRGHIGMALDRIDP